MGINSQERADIELAKFRYLKDIDLGGLTSGILMNAKDIRDYCELFPRRIGMREMDDIEECVNILMTLLVEHINGQT